MSDENGKEKPASNASTRKQGLGLTGIHIPKILPDDVQWLMDIVESQSMMQGAFLREFSLQLDLSSLTQQVIQHLQPLHHTIALHLQQPQHDWLHMLGIPEDYTRIAESIKLASQINAASFLPAKATLERLKADLEQYHQVLDTASKRGWLLEMVLGFLPWNVAQSFIELYLEDQFDEADSAVLAYFQHRADHLLTSVKTAMFESLPEKDADYRYSRFEPTVLALRDEDEAGYRYSAIAMYAEAEGYFVDLAVARGLLNRGDSTNLLYGNNPTSTQERQRIIQALVQTITDPHPTQHLVTARQALSPTKQAENNGTIHTSRGLDRNKVQHGEQGSGVILEALKPTLFYAYLALFFAGRIRD